MCLLWRLQIDSFLPDVALLWRVSSRTIEKVARHLTLQKEIINGDEMALYHPQIQITILILLHLDK